MKYDISTIKRRNAMSNILLLEDVNRKCSDFLKKVKDMPPAGTDGKTIYYNPDFLEKISVEEQTFIFAHESMPYCF